MIGWPREPSPVIDWPAPSARATAAAWRRDLSARIRRMAGILFGALGIAILVQGIAGPRPEPSKIPPRPALSEQLDMIWSQK